MEAANNDPLRAKEIEEEIDRLWWERWLIDRKYRGEAMEKKYGS